MLYFFNFAQKNIKGMNFIEELQWRGMIQDIMPGTEELLNKEMVTAYVGIDPTADSLHIGHLVSIMMLRHLQNYGHKPIAVVGGATGMIGDPSGKSKERNLLDENELRYNQECIRKQLMRFLDFDTSSPNCAEIVNNYDWTKDYSFLGFLRDIGKHITVNYMMAKDSVRKRIAGEDREGMSFTEFTYQLVQGFDFLYLYEHKNCKLQMGGSDQWGNITTGTELIRRKTGGEAFALTCPLITKADGGKFGKTESGNIWLDPEKTSPYSFYQFWLNCSDADAEKYIKIFTFLSCEEVNECIENHRKEPHLRMLQKTLAREITCRIHSTEDYDSVIKASEILFGKGTEETLKSLDDCTFNCIFEGVPVFEIDEEIIIQGIGILELLTEKTNIFASRGEARRMMKDKGVMLNKKAVDDTALIYAGDLINNKYLVVQKGKKNYFLIKLKK